MQIDHHSVTKMEVPTVNREEICKLVQQRQQWPGQGACIVALSWQFQASGQHAYIVVEELWQGGAPAMKGGWGWRKLQEGGRVSAKVKCGSTHSEGGRQLWLEERQKGMARLKAQVLDTRGNPVPVTRGRKVYSCMNFHAWGI